MITQWRVICAVSLLLVVVTACTLPQDSQATPVLTLVIPPSPTLPPSTDTPSIPTLTTPTNTVVPPTVSIPTTGVTLPTQASSGIIPGSPSGPYAVVLVEPNDALNIRSAPGVNNAVVGSFSAIFNNVQRAGPSSIIGEDLWVEVNNPTGGKGWVNSAYLAEYVPQTDVCDPKAMTLLTNFERAITTSDGVLLASLVSPRHGVDVWAYRSGRPITFDTEHIRWVFQSTYSHNWGSHPASGLDTMGPFQQVILPMLKDVYNTDHEVHCNERGVPGWNISAWPEKYTNYHVYKIYKPGTAGVDLDYRVWLVGMEYISGQPYLTVLINFIWTP